MCVPAMNAPARIIVPKGRTSNTTINESVAYQKCGKPIGSKDSTPWKQRVNEKSCPKKALEENVHNALEEVLY